MTVETFRRLRAAIPTEFKQKDCHPLFLSTSQPLSDILIFGILICLVTWLVFWVILSFLSLESPGQTASIMAVFLMFTYWILPFLSMVRINFKGVRINLSEWRSHSAAHQIIACVAFTYIFGSIFYETTCFVRRYVQQSRESGAGGQQTSALTPKATHRSLNQQPLNRQTVDQQRMSRRDNTPLTSLTPTQIYLFGWPLCSLSLYGLMLWLSRPKDQKMKSSQGRDNKGNDKGNDNGNNKGSHEGKEILTNTPPFSLWLGESTGQLANLWHHANLAPEQQVGLTLQEATQNIVILGAIGSGKTTRAMQPLLIQLLDQDCGGLIFDIKGDFKKAVLAFALEAKREPVLIGVGQQSLNLLEGLSPEIAASFLKSAFLLAGSAKTDSFWIDTSVELCRHALGVLSFIPEHYHLNGLYQYLFDASFQKEIHTELTKKAMKPEDERLLKTYQHYLRSIFATFDEKVRSGVLANIAQILSPFQHPELVDTFCMSQPQADPTDDPAIDSVVNSQINLGINPAMEAVLEGTIYVVDMPLARWGLAGKVIYTLIKLRFFNLMQQRALQETWNQSRPVFFMCDEYQEIVSCNKDGLSDLNFWDKSRSSQTIGIISAQSISSFYAAIGDRDLVHALLQNFRQKLVFRVEDDWTISYCNRLIGQVETQKIVHSTGSGKQGKSSSESISYQQKEVVDGQLFRNMKANQALALLSLNGCAADDVLTVKPLFVPDDVSTNSLTIPS